MNRISYRHTNVPKQFLCLSIFVYVLMQAIIMGEIIIWKLEGFYEELNIPLTIFLYLIYFTLVLLFSYSYRFCYTLYGENKLVYYNKLLRREISYNLNDAKLAVFDKKGVKFYADSNADYENKEIKPEFFIPFYRGGIIQAVEINNFFKKLIDREGLRVIKTFEVLPGYSKKWKILSVIYLFLAFGIFLNCATPLTVIIILFQNH